MTHCISIQPVQDAVCFGQNVTFSQAHGCLCLCTEIIHCEKMLGVGFSWRWQLQCAVPGDTGSCWHPRWGWHWVPGTHLLWEVWSSMGLFLRRCLPGKASGRQEWVLTTPREVSVHLTSNLTRALSAFLLLTAFQGCFIASVLISHGSKLAE